MTAMEFGKGESFRRPGWLERAAATCGRALGASSARQLLAGPWHAVLDRMPGDRLTSRFPGGEQVRLSAAFRHMTWNMQEYDAFRRDVRPGDVVLDIGANVGAYTLLFALWSRPSGHVYAFEPAPDARRGLARHVALNTLGSSVTIVPDAVSAGPGRAAFRASGAGGDNRLDSSAAAGDAAIAAIEVATTSIDEFCRAPGRTPALIKIDAEGAELDVLRGARQTIAAAGSRLALYVEMHPHLWSGFGASREAIEAELAAQGLMAERLDGHPDIWNLEGVCLRLRRCGS